MQWNDRRQAEEENELARAQDADLEAFQHRLQASMEEELKESNDETRGSCQTSGQDSPEGEATMAPGGGVEERARQIPEVSCRVLTYASQAAKSMLKTATRSHQ